MNLTAVLNQSVQRMDSASLEYRQSLYKKVAGGVLSKSVPFPGARNYNGQLSLKKFNGERDNLGYDPGWEGDAPIESVAATLELEDANDKRFSGQLNTNGYSLTAKPGSNGHVINGFVGQRNGSAFPATGDQRSPKAVEVRNVYKGYSFRRKEIAVLKGINLSVPHGAIYGLLGPSGCGKTTLLRCIIGRLNVSGGEINVFGYNPGTRESGVPGRKVGYMPQEIALFVEFSIEETLQYFGRIHKMTAENIKKRTDFLLEFLHLPRDGRFVKALSGGQKRRVSFAVALLHEPSLLILDEPTVGVDPLLRQSIWQHLVTIARGGDTTIIITTHYIEEARQAHAVGLMRNGRLLAEASPDVLISQHNLPSLEEVFLKLCLQDSNNDDVAGHQQSTNGNNLDSVETQLNAPLPGLQNGGTMNGYTHTSSPDPVKEYPNPRYSSSKKRSKCSPCTWPFSSHKLAALTIKNLVKMYRNPGFMAFQFILPSIQIILFCIAIGHTPRDLPVAVVNEEGVFPDLLNYGELFLQHIDNISVVQREYKTLDEAKLSVREGHTYAVIQIPQNFSQDFISRVYACTTADNATLQGSTVRVYLDNTNQQISYAMREVVLLAFQNFSQTLMKRSGLQEGLGDIPVSFEEPIQGGSNPSFTEFMAPGIILSVAYFMAVGLTSLAFVIERKEGLLDRTLVCGVNTSEVLLGHFATQFMVMAIQCACALFFIIVVFQMPCRGPVYEVVILTILQGMCGMTYGLLISAFCDEENSAVMFALGSFYPNLMLCGVIWPVEGMPLVLQYISYALPQTYAVEGLRALMLKGWDFTYRLVWMSYLITSSWMLFFLILAAIVFRLRR